MPAQRDLLARFLEPPACSQLYHQRRNRYPKLASLVPESLKDVVNDRPPWFCHGLGLRMATWDAGSECVFARFDKLLALVQYVPGWQREWVANWEHESLADYDKFFHLLWMLQCFEFFKKTGSQVEFLALAAPDLRITPIQQPDDAFYVECYVYSKWWFVEVFLEDELLRLVGSDLRLRRTFNLPRQINDRCGFLDGFAAVLTDDKLAEARSQARHRYPVLLHEKQGLTLVVKGSDVRSYVPQPNAHGDPSSSLPVFLREIVKAKKGKNGLVAHHPNLLMANGLGKDFQLALGRMNPACFTGVDLADLDAILVMACGIGGSLTHCDRREFFSLQDVHPAQALLGAGR